MKPFILITNFSHDEIVRALGEYVVGNRAPKFEGTVTTEASMTLKKGELAAHVTVTLKPKRQRRPKP